MSENIPNLPEIQKTVPKPDPPSHTDEKSKSAAEKEQQLLEKEQSEHKRDQTTRVIFAYGMWALVVVVFCLDDQRSLYTGMAYFGTNMVALVRS